MTECLWGVDSYSPADTVVHVPNRYRRAGETRHVHERLYDYVTRRAGREPRFWGRYLNKHHPSGLKENEADYIFRRSSGRCRVLPVYNGLRGQPARGHRGRDDGEAVADAVIETATEYDVPPGVCIYLDLEGWTVQAEFIEGWWQRMRASPWGEAVGIYGRGAEVRHVRGGYAPRPGRHHSSGWARRIDAAEQDVADEELEELVDAIAEGEAYRPNKHFIWSNTPRRVDSSHDTPHDAQIIPHSFAAAGPVGAMLSETVVWQYRFSAFWQRNAHRGTVDLDLARPAAYAYMWRDG